MKVSPLSLVFMWLVSGVSGALAGVTLALDAPVVNLAAGSAVAFSGTLTNTHATVNAFLNEVQVSVPAGLALQPNTFFANVPGILLPGESYTGPIFSAALSGSASPGDYACTVAMKGGAGISASDELAMAGFTVLSPLVTIVATVPDAAEFGPVSGTFTVTRSGLTSIPLAVPFTIAGSAVNGSACAVILPSAVLPQGVSSADVSVTPIPNDVSEGERTVLLTLAPSTTANLGASTSAKVTIHDKPADHWRFQHFGADAGTPAAADAGDWEQDGISNLLEFGLSLDPKASDALAMPRPMLVDGYLRLSFAPNPAATDLLYVVESSVDLTSWGTDDVIVEALATPVRTYRYRYRTGEMESAFLRLRVNRLP